MDWKEAYERAKARKQNEQDRQMDLMRTVLDTGLTFAGLGLVGYLHGRKGGIPAVGGIPIDAAGGAVLGLGGLGLVMAGYESGRHVAAFGTGLGGYWFASYMADFGAKRREKAGERLGRELTADEARAANVVTRPPVLAGAGVWAHQYANVQ